MVCRIVARDSHMSRVSVRHKAFHVRSGSFVNPLADNLPDNLGHEPIARPDDACTSYDAAGFLRNDRIAEYPSSTTARPTTIHKK
jgi:hypothetical protein